MLHAAGPLCEEHIGVLDLDGSGGSDVKIDRSMTNAPLLFQRCNVSP